MTKRILLSLILWGGVVFSAFSHDFTATNQGKTIYYTITNADKKEVAVAPNGTSTNSYEGDIVIPEKVINPNDGLEYTVTSIAASAFKRSYEGATGGIVTSVELPETITSIGDYAFRNCSTYLTDINIPTAVESIGTYAFDACKGITSITLSSNLTSLGQQAFNACTAITVINYNAESLSDFVNNKGPFYGCTTAITLNIGNNVTTIPAYAFQGANITGTVTIPDNVETINASAFYGLTSISKLIIGSGVTTFGNSVFSGCTGLTEIIAKPTTVPASGYSLFYNVTKSIPVYIPSGSKESYTANLQWNGFTNFKDLIEYTSPVVFYNGETLNTGIILLTGSGSVTIQNGGKVRCDNILGATPENLIIEDGGQLAVSSSGIQATFQKGIHGYTSTKDRYYLIANPTTTVIDPAKVEGMLSNEYDLFYFDESEEGAEWRNYKQGAFNLENGKGYLYANSEDLPNPLAFAGTVPTSTSANITLKKAETGTYKGFNLIGNPMSVNITSMYIGDSECSYYKLNPTTGVFSASTATIIVGEAFMVEAPTNEATLSLNPGAKGENGFNNDVIRLEVSNNKYTDVAYLYFGNHLPLTKINHLNDEAPMLYIHNEKADRAVAVMNDRSEVKSVNVNFEAKTMGSYTISGKAEKGNFSYMHLYDRLTGTDTDLLNTDYTFIGSKTDAAGRFILRFEAIDNNSESESFAYQNGSDIIINGTGELQIFDVMGRRVLTMRVSGEATITAPSMQGVYIFKLNDKTQKIVVK